MVQPGQLTSKAEVVAVVETLANNNAKLPHKPFAITGVREPVERGGFVFGTVHNTGEQVEFMGYVFVCETNNNPYPPLDPNTRNPNPGWKQPWQSCYQRVRDSLHEAASVVGVGIDLWKQSVSGPWPCQLPSIYYNHIEFYYPDTGKQESVTIGGNVAPANAGGAQGTFTVETSELFWGEENGVIVGKFPVVVNGTEDNPGDTQTVTAVTGPAADDHLGQFRVQYLSGSVMKIGIGGTQPLTINGTFFINCTAYRGLLVGNSFDTPDNQPFALSDVDPAGLVNVDAGGFLPGAGFTPSFGGWGAIDLGGLGRNVYRGTITLTCKINGTFAPGIYSLAVSTTATPNNSASGQLIATNTGDGIHLSGVNTWQFDTFVDVGNTLFFYGSCGLVSTATVEVPGIHDTKRIFKISAPPFSAATDLPAGLWFGRDYYTYTDDSRNSIGEPIFTPTYNLGGFAQIPETGPNPQALTFVRETYAPLPMAVTASTAGFWFAVTSPVSSLGLCPWEKMPWNIFPVSTAGANAGSAKVNQYLGYTAPYLFGTNFSGTTAIPAYSGDGPSWVRTSAANELLPWPKRWKAGTHYPGGYTIQDSNGNYQIVDQEGRSGAIEPGWPVKVGDTITEADYSFPPHTIDHGVRWRLTRVFQKPVTIARGTAYGLGQTLYDDYGNRQTVTVAGTTATPLTPAWNRAALGFTVDGTVTWQLTSLGAIQPAVARITPPVYPCFWKNPVAGQTDPPPVLTNDVFDPATGKPVFDFAPQGWWIYRVALNKIPQTKTTDKPDTAPVAVTIGCIRNGAFVAFGTYNTGTVINAYWPIFTNTALCYTAAERVDIQASILTCGNNYGTWGGVDYPFAATYLNDVETLLGLLQ